MLPGVYRHKTRLLLQCPEDPKIDLHFYKLRFPASRPGSRVTVNAAKLRLYKVGVAGSSSSSSPTPRMVRITVFWLKLRNTGVKPATQVRCRSLAGVIR